MLPVVFVGSLLMIAAATAAQDRDQKDEDKIQGVWLVVLMEKGGEKAPIEVSKDAKMTITDGTFKMELAGRAENGTVTYKLDPSKTPKQIDITESRGGKNDVVIGIYSLDGDDLKICFSKDIRPKDLATQAGDNNFLLVLKRDKK
jgi:uncharacterized protein (TIGR03067 family)